MKRCNGAWHGGLIAVLVVLLSVFFLSPAGAAKPWTAKEASDAATVWLVKHYQDPGVMYAEDPNNPKSPRHIQDTNVMLESILAVEAAGDVKDARAMLQAVAKDLDLVISCANEVSGPANTCAPHVARLVSAVLGAGENPSSFHGKNLVALLQSLIYATGPLTGLLHDAGPTVSGVDENTGEKWSLDSVGTEDQAWAVIALAALGKLKPAMIDVLETQRCAQGMSDTFFFETDGALTTCDSTVMAGAVSRISDNATALALSAYEAAAASGAGDENFQALLNSLASGLALNLTSGQRVDGSWSEGVSITGKAVQALSGVCNDPTELKDPKVLAVARSFVRANQVEDSSGLLKHQVGGVAPDSTAIDRAKLEAVDNYREWTINTTGASLALTAKPLWSVVARGKHPLPNSGCVIPDSVESRPTATVTALSKVTVSATATATAHSTATTQHTVYANSPSRPRAPRTRYVVSVRRTPEREAESAGRSAQGQPSGPASASSTAQPPHPSVTPLNTQTSLGLASASASIAPSSPQTNAQVPWWKRGWAVALWWLLAAGVGIALPVGRSHLPRGARR